MFVQQIRRLVTVMEEMGNPFLEQSTDLLKFDTRDIVQVESSVSSICQAEHIERQQF